MDKIDNDFAFWIGMCAFLIVVSLSFGYIVGNYNSKTTTSLNSLNDLDSLNRPIAPDTDYISNPVIKDNYDVIYKNGNVTTCFDNAILATSASGNSMIPSIYDGQKPLYMKVTNVSSLQVGDIIAYYSEADSTPLRHVVISHRIIEIGEDAEGVYFITKGDNNPVSDGKVRPNKIEYILAGIIY